MVASARVLAAVLVLLVLAALAWVLPAVGEESCAKGTLFYVYGLTTCPYCKRQIEFFKSIHPEGSVICYVDASAACNEGFELMTYYMLNHTTYTVNISSLQIYQLLGSVPRTLVVKNNTYVLGVVVGLVDNWDFWSNISCSQPSSKIPLYVGSTIIGYVDAGSVNHSELIKHWLTPVEGAKVSPPAGGSEQGAGAGWSLSQIVLVAAASVAVAAGLYFAFRKILK